MKTNSLLLASAAVFSPFVLGLSTPATHVRFAPSEGSSLTKTFENKASLSLDEYTITGTGAQSPDMEMTLTTNQKVTVTDEYTKIQDGVPGKLTRTFDDMAGDTSMAMKMTMMGQVKSDEQNMRLKSELEGKKVVFTWDAEKSEYAKAFDPAEEKVDTLEGLNEDMDFRALVPTSEVKEGDEWDIPLSGLKHVLSPGGSLAMAAENADDKALKMGSEMSSLSSMIGDKMEGKAKAKLTSVKDIDGVSCAQIHIELKVHSAADMTEAARKMLKDSELPPGVAGLEIDHLDIEFSFEGEGELVWDIPGGHFRAFDLSGQTTIKSDQGMKLEVQGKSMTLGETREMSGTSSFGAKAK